ncbi:MAG: glycerophosphodiester phosphodiesterase family protein [Thalassobaculaceae bacterium]|nr:glycerophosphodiester phosphodiesterase family protein [Thalassobaculaceae bacterium]
MSPARPWVIAHRGDSAHKPENSLAALDSAIAAGADAVECDVRIAGDGILVVSHDADLTRLAGKPAVVEQTPADDLARIAEAAGASILRLSAFLDAARGRTRLMLDVKSLDPAVIDGIAAAVAETGFDPGDIALGLRNADLVGAARAPLSGARILALHGGGAPLDAFLSQGVDLIRLWERDATADTISALKDRGCTVWTTTGGPETDRAVGDSHMHGLATLIAAGIDGLLVNDPVLGRRAVDATL